MDDHGFILWQEEDNDPNYEIIEREQEDHVEGYEEVNMENDETDVDGHQSYYMDEGMIPAPQENLIYLHDDNIVNGSSQFGVGMSHLIEQRVQEAENKIIGDQDDQEEFTATVEEVITEEDWIQSQGEELVQVAMEQVIASENFTEDDVDTVPLQTDQDEYTTSRPYPCDFCSRRFRKKANLMNHMVAHQNVRPHMCNLCGSRYVRKCDLINHLKIHAYNIEDEVLGLGSSTTGGKKRPHYDELDYLNDYDEDLPDSDEFDYMYSSKPTIVATTSSTTTKSSKSIKHVKKKPAKKQAIKVEKVVKEKPIVQESLRQSSDDDHQIIDRYVERYPITDPRKPFVCQHCGVAFTREKALESHTKLHANQEPTFDCEICNDTFFDNNSLEEHMELRHDYSTRARRTGGKSTGGKTSAGTSSGTQAMETLDYDDSNSEYEPEKNIDFDDDDDEDNGHTCDKCHTSFKNSESLKRHIKTHFIKSEILSDDEDLPAINSALGCNVCGESFIEALDLLAHAEEHARFQPFKCQLCGETFFEENKIKIHLMDNHQNELTEASCRLCGKQCRDQRSLIKHSWEHSREKNHPCSKCGKSFHNKARLKRHISSHRNKSVMCEICHEEFPDGRQLMNHRHSHTKANQFPCHECGKTFGSRSSQQIHLRIHTGERPYACRYCWKAFADGGTLRKHERIHTGEKPYCCLVCPRAFNQRVVLREHIRSHHSAPDSQHGTTLTPYYCSLCGDLFSVSLDLIHHLIEHSDRSTAAKRVQPTGPRKYKRRRKLNGESNDNDFITLEGNFTRFQKSIKEEPLDYDNTIIATKKLLSSNASSILPLPSDFIFADSEFKLPDEIFQTATKKYPKVSSPSRPKMIYTQKTRVQATHGKRKTKTMIQKRVLSRTTRLSRQRQQQLQQQKPVKQSIDEYESMESESWSNDDPNEDVLDTLLKRERKLSEKFTSDLVNDLQEILRSPIKMPEEKKPPNGDTGMNRRPVFTSYGAIAPESLSTIFGSPNKDNQLLDDDEIENIVIKKEIFDDGHLCGICGDSFETRAQLLSHVPIHI